MDVADILEKAAELIEPEGAWGQRRASKATGRGLAYCMMGAIHAAAKGDVAGISDARDVLISVLPMPRAAKPAPVVAFNDAPERTQAEVVAKLREAAAKARGQGRTA